MMMTSLNFSKTFFIILCVTCYTSYTSQALPYHKTTYKISTIAAEPAVLPYSPTYAPGPALSPDITPLFPTPASGSSPDSSLPTIPSSPSPPNPDSLATPHPELGISPTGSMPESSAFALNMSVLHSLAMLVLVFIAF